MRSYQPELLLCNGWFVYRNQPSTEIENRAFSIMLQQQNKTSRTGKRAIQLAGSAVEGSLDLDLDSLFLSSFPGYSGVVLYRLAFRPKGKALSPECAATTRRQSLRRMLNTNFKTTQSGSNENRPL
jgi:hypothetical protein